MSKSAFVAVVGRPSAGKSTLVNALCGQKVSIVSPVPQTTRNAIRGIHNSPAGQLVFVDTPGYHNSERKFNLKLTNLVKGSLGDADLVLYLVDQTRPFGEEEAELMAMVARSSKPVVVALNKADQVLSAGNYPAQVRAAVQAGLPEAARIIDISALTGNGLEELKADLYGRAPDGHEWYPGEYYTDQEPDFRIAEIIREQVMNHTREEIPHAAYVEVDELDLRQPDGTIIAPGSELDPGATWELPLSKKPRLNVQATICVERESQKGIIIGKSGALIREMREAAEREIRELFPYYVTLELRVKVDPKWRSDDKRIDRMVH